jgi:hypothetical protein
LHVQQLEQEQEKAQREREVNVKNIERGKKGTGYFSGLLS